MTAYSAFDAIDNLGARYSFRGPKERSVVIIKGRSSPHDIEKPRSFPRSCMRYRSAPSATSARPVHRSCNVSVAGTFVSQYRVA